MSNIHVVIKGTLVSVTGTKINLSRVGESAPNSVHDVKGCPVTLNGKDCELKDLQPKDLIVMRGDPITRVDATRD